MTAHEQPWRAVEHCGCAQSAVLAVELLKLQHGYAEAVASAEKLCAEAWQAGLELGVRLCAETTGALEHEQERALERAKGMNPFIKATPWKAPFR